MKNKILILIISICVICSLVFIFIYNNKTKNNELFSLDNEYYGNGQMITIDKDRVNNLINNKSSFILFTYNSYCSFEVPCDEIFNSVISKNKIEMLQIPFDEFKNTKAYNYIKYAPSVIIFKNGKVVSYLDANKDEDLSKYQNEKDFENWLKEYILFK